MVAQRIKFLDIKPNTYFNWSNAEIAQAIPELSVIFCSTSDIDSYYKVFELHENFAVPDIKPAREGQYFVVSDENPNKITDGISQADFEAIYTIDTQSKDSFEKMPAKLIPQGIAKIPFIQVSGLKTMERLRFNEINGRSVHVKNDEFVIKMPHGGFCAIISPKLSSFLRPI